MARIAIAGWHHETNTFAPTKADYAAFAEADGWPALSRGGVLLDALAGINIPASGFIEAARADGHELAPLLWCSASPSAHVTKDAYERIAAMIVADAVAARRLDALYLDMHGAMVAEHLEDGEGELIGRLRKALGPELPIFVSLDFHANVTPAMVKGANVLVAYRTYPHIDMAETGMRTASLLGRALKNPGLIRAKAYRQVPYLMSLPWQCTLIEPAQSIQSAAAAAERGAVASASVPLGFPLADIRDSGATVLAYASDARSAEGAADALLKMMLDREGEFAGKLWEPREAVRHAMGQVRAGAKKPVVLADTQDNPGAGADGDTTGLLAALVAERAEGAVLGVLSCAETAKIAHQAGVGAEITLGLGERSRLPGHAPFHATFKVLKLGSGQFTATGPFYSGSCMQLGPMALLDVAGVRVAVSSRKQQCADQAMLHHVGVEPAAEKILALKSSVHFRADFQPLAHDVIVVAAPGPAIADTNALPYKRLRPGLRVSPGGRVFAD